MKDEEDFDRGDIYSDSGVEDSIENDEIDAAEEGFMVGYLSSY